MTSRGTLRDSVRSLPGVYSSRPSGLTDHIGVDRSTGTTSHDTLRDSVSIARVLGMILTPSGLTDQIGVQVQHLAIL